jgi:hypothetical protein
VIIGSVVLSADESKHNKLAKCIANNPVINLGAQPRSKDLVVMDDPNLDALPPSIEVYDNPHTTEKHAQLGYQACGKILSACLNDLASGDGRYAVLLVDLSVHVGDMIKAVAETAFSRPLMCVGLCEGADHKDFVQAEIMHFLKIKLLTDDGFKIPGFTIPPKDVPLDEISVPTPALTALGWRCNNIVMKDSDRNTWSLHDTFQAQFDELVTAMNQANAHCSAAWQQNNVDTHVKQERMDSPPHKKMR